MTGERELSKEMSEQEFDNGYWYAGQLRVFARRLGIAGAGKLRKDELEEAIRHFLRTGEVRDLARRELGKQGMRDVDRGLSLELEVSQYTSNKETKEFIQREALKIDPGFTPVSGTRYLLNRWREEQIAKGRRITYGDLVQQAIELSRTKSGPLRILHGRYMNFISDYMTANADGTMAEAIAAWHAVKQMDLPKTYSAWAEATRDKP